jgi:hypothetical protein
MLFFERNEKRPKLKQYRLTRLKYHEKMKLQADKKNEMNHGDER